MAANFPQFSDPTMKVALAQHFGLRKSSLLLRPGSGWNWPRLRSLLLAGVGHTGNRQMTWKHKLYVLPVKKQSTHGMASNNRLSEVLVLILLSQIVFLLMVTFPDCVLAQTGAIASLMQEQNQQRNHSINNTILICKSGKLAKSKLW